MRASRGCGRPAGRSDTSSTPAAAPPRSKAAAGCARRARAGAVQQRQMAAAAAAAASGERCFMGIDFGTSGARVTVIDGACARCQRQCASAGAPAVCAKLLLPAAGLPAQAMATRRPTTSRAMATMQQPTGQPPGSGEACCRQALQQRQRPLTRAHPRARRVLFELIAALPADVRSRVTSVAFDGTSATALLVDAASGKVLAPAKLYSEAQGPDAVQAAQVRRTRGSSLAARLLAFRAQRSAAYAMLPGHRAAITHGDSQHVDAVQGADVAPGGHLAGRSSGRRTALPAAPGGLACLPAARCERDEPGFCCSVPACK